MVTLVTGGAGFVGKHLVAALRARGEKVRVLDIKPVTYVDAIAGSVTDGRSAEEACDGATSVFHLAGDARLWAPNARVFDEVNHQGTRVMLKAARAAGVSRFVQCSSLTTLVAAEVPIGPSVANENTRIPPERLIGPYPKSKARADAAVEEAVAEGFDASIAIPTEPLGAGDDGLTPPTRMMLDFARGKTPAYINCTLNFVPVECLADGLIAVRDRGDCGEKYLLGGQNIPMQTLLEALGRMVGRKMPRLALPYSFALAAGIVDTHIVSRITAKEPKAPLTGVRLAGRQVSFSSEKSASSLDWRASDFNAALQQTVDWFREKGMIS
ncbi:MAG: NAD-dependent epimerase/dehydratase family protein [Pseudomonadota bacterium]